MCNTYPIQVLSQTENGCIYLCNGCGTYNVIFKNILLFLSEKELAVLKDIFCKQLGVRELATPIWKKMNFLVQTPFPNACFCFNKEEYQEFVILLTKAMNRLHTERLLQGACMN